MPNSRRLLPATLATCCLALAACGGSESASDTTLTASTTSAAPSSSVASSLAPATSAPDPVATTAAPTTSPSTAPETTADTTTTSSTEAPTTTAAETTTTTSAPPPTQLDEWPAPPAPAELANVPYLLPSMPIDGAVDAIRTDSEQPPAGASSFAGDYVQFWVSDDGTDQVTIRTHLSGEPVGSEDFREPVDVEGWESAFSFETAPPFASVVLVAAEGYVEIESYGIEQDDLVGVARSLTRRGGGEPGWTSTDLADLRAVHEGWGDASIGTAGRDLDWYDAERQLEAEIAIGIGQPLRFADVWRFDQAVTFDDVNGAEALVVQLQFGGTDAPTIVVWSPAPGQTVQFGIAAPPSEALEIARTIGPVSVDVWNRTARAPEFPPDGCNSFVC